MHNRSVKLIAFSADKETPGVSKKLNDQSVALMNLGYSVTVRKLGFTSKFNGFRYLRSILAAKENVIFLRLSPNFFFNFFLWIPLIVCRIRGQIVLIDVPTPLHIGIREVINSGFSLFHKIYYSVTIIVAFPWVVIPANKILVYAPERYHFSWIIRKKTKLIGNGINLDEIPLIKMKSSRSSKSKIELVGVGIINTYHGFDRIIKSMAERIQTDDSKDKNFNNTRIKFHIIGNGPALNSLKQLVDELDLAEFVNFVGPLYGDSLFTFLGTMDVGIASLAGFRVGLTDNSDLKSRMYLGCGLPIVQSIPDLDIPSASEFVFCVPDNNDPIDLDGLASWYYQEEFWLKGPEIREYAERNLTYTSKMRDVMADICD